MNKETKTCVTCGSEIIVDCIKDDSGEFILKGTCTDCDSVNTFSSKPVLSERIKFYSDKDLKNLEEKINNLSNKIINKQFQIKDDLYIVMITYLIY